MRKFLFLAAVAARESMEEPLSPLLFFSAFCVMHLVPVFHYHQFGEPGRLARECGLSALLVFGLIVVSAAVSRGLVRAFARGTAAVAITRDVSRSAFFVAQVLGSMSILVLFAVASLFATSLAVETSVVGVHLVENGESFKAYWAPGLQLGVIGTIAAFACAALANRFASWRFCSTACIFTAAVQPVVFVIGAFLKHDAWQVLCQLSGAFIALFCSMAAFGALAGALSVRLRPALASGLMALCAVVSFLCPVKALLPAVTSFWLADELANGGVPAWSDVARGSAAGIVIMVLWLVIGTWLFDKRDVA